MFCSNCGNELSDSAKFCSNCGKKVELSSVPIDEDFVIESDSSHEQSKNETGTDYTSKILWGIAAFILGAWTAFILTRNVDWKLTFPGAGLAAIIYNKKNSSDIGVITVSGILGLVIGFILKGGM